MTDPPLLRDALTLDGTAASAGAARRFLTDVLGRWECPSLVDDAVLCVSEIVGNAVVHAETPCELRVEWRPPRLRVEVYDQNPRSAIGPRTISTLSELVAADGGDGDDGRDGDDGEDEASLAAMSGRGLFIVASLSEALGEMVDGPGKVVWFELEDHGGPVTPGLAAIVQEVADEESVRRHHPLDGLLAGVPVAIAVRSEDHIADVRRELKLLGGPHPVAGLLPALDALGGAFPYGDSGAEQVRVAAGVRRALADVGIPLTEQFLAQLRHVHALLIEADDLAAAGRLLARPATPRLRRFWAWSVDEVAAQLAGRSPTPYAG